MNTLHSQANASVPIDIDGSQGEGGGQVLRTSLSLSMLSGRPVRLHNVRAGRRKPGLMRQHLTCVLAAARVCSAQVEGAAIGSTTLEFRPGPIEAGDYGFAIGSAGSTALVLQTVLPALLQAPGRSRLRIEGGTHVPMAPCADFIEHAFLPVLRDMGAAIDFRLERHGFYPAGGGAIEVMIDPRPLQPLALDQRGALTELVAEAMVSQLPTRIVERELDALKSALPYAQLKRRELGAGCGPGNALVLRAQFEHACEVRTSLGLIDLSSEEVAQLAVSEFKRHLAHGAPVGEHLADQLLLPLWLAGGGEFVTCRPSTHLETNIAVMRAFGKVEISLEPDLQDPQRRWRVALQRDGLAGC
ncbi:MAG: RNA 3'-terminal phosphate cyclase [Xanthomonadales bacterium]|nr:RNA 3'-terminal phosphate cyclase [Xanthomonadales bacterium]